MWQQELGRSRMTSYDYTNPRKRACVRLFGASMGIAGLVFAVYTFTKGLGEITQAELRLGPLTLAAAIGLAGMTTIGLNWVRIIRITSGSGEAGTGLRW